MDLRYLFLFAVAFFVACDAQSSTEAASSLMTEEMAAKTTAKAPEPTPEPEPEPTENEDKEEASPVPAMMTKPPAVELTTKEEEMQKDAPAAETAATTTMETKTEEKAPTTEPATTPKPAAETAEPTRMTVKGSSTLPPLVHSVSTETPKTDAVTKKPNETKHESQNASSPITSGATLIILGVAISRYLSCSY